MCHTHTHTQSTKPAANLCQLIGIFAQTLVGDDYDLDAALPAPQQGAGGLVALLADHVHQEVALCITRAERQLQGRGRERER